MQVKIKITPFDTAKLLDLTLSAMRKLAEHNKKCEPDKRKRYAYVVAAPTIPGTQEWRYSTSLYGCGLNELLLVRVIVNEDMHTGGFQLPEFLQGSQGYGQLHDALHQQWQHEWPAVFGQVAP